MPQRASDGFWTPSAGESQYSLPTNLKLSNANIIYTFFSDLGWTRLSICAMLGNMDIESRMNPLAELISADSYGLVQWHPSSKLWNWATNLGLDYELGSVQCQRIKYEWDNELQWDVNDESDITFHDFTAYTENDITMARAVHLWRWLYEVADPATEPQRLEWANYYYTHVHRLFPIWLLFKRRKELKPPCRRI